MRWGRLEARWINVIVRLCPLGILRFRRVRSHVARSCMPLDLFKMAILTDACVMKDTNGTPRRKLVSMIAGPSPKQPAWNTTA